MYACLHADEVGNEMQENADLHVATVVFYFIVMTACYIMSVQLLVS